MKMHQKTWKSRKCGLRTRVPLIGTRVPNFGYIDRTHTETPGFGRFDLIFSRFSLTVGAAPAAVTVASSIAEGIAYCRCDLITIPPGEGCIKVDNTSEEIIVGRSTNAGSPLDSRRGVIAITPGRTKRGWIKVGTIRYRRRDLVHTTPGGGWIDVGNARE